MEARKLEVIKQLMEELQGLMQPGAEDLGERLGRPKVEIEMHAEGEDPDMEEAEESLGMDLDNDMEMGEAPDHASKVLKKRIMQMRG